MLLEQKANVKIELEDYMGAGCKELSGPSYSLGFLPTAWRTTGRFKAGK